MASIADVYSEQNLHCNVTPGQISLYQVTAACHREEWIEVTRSWYSSDRAGLAAARQELQEFSSVVHVQSLRSCEVDGIFCYFVFRYICVTSIL